MDTRDEIEFRRRLDEEEEYHRERWLFDQATFKVPYWKRREEWDAQASVSIKE